MTISLILQVEQSQATTSSACLDDTSQAIEVSDIESLSDSQVVEEPTSIDVVCFTLVC